MLEPSTVIPLFKHNPALDTKGVHYSFIKERIEGCFTEASVQRAQALSRVRLALTDWQPKAENPLKIANMEAWRAQNAVDRMFAKLQDIHAFAEPLLKKALTEKYNLDIDVKRTYLHLYIPRKNPWYVIETSKGVTTRTVSLLNAALHNFAIGDAFEADSDFITRPDARGHFEIAPIKQTMSIGQFQTLCRELDIGALYKRHLENMLLPTSPVGAAFLQHKVSASQRAAFKAATHLALLKKDISRTAHDVALGLLEERHGLTLDGKVMQACDLMMMDAHLTGIVLFTAVEQQSHGVDKVIAYVPHDPEHPMKEYPSARDFITELTRQLRENAVLPSTGATYQQFFSQFVGQQQRGHFFAALAQRLSSVTWHQKQALDPLPTWRESPLDKPNLQFFVTPIRGPLWEYLYRQSLNKVLNDAREIAVSTADTDSNARWAWWDNFKKIASDIFNVALLVLTPFVPGLGELMLVYTAYQLTSDVIEGVMDLAEGLWAQTAEHVIGIVTDVIQLGAFAVAGAIGNEFRLKLSPLIEGMKPVQLPSGESRLWNPDLTPYEQNDLSLSNASMPDVSGLHRREDHHILPLDSRLYKVKQDPGTGEYRIQHPRRPGAYAPKLAHNGRGAWAHEGENPCLWDKTTLMKRLGHSTDGLTPEQLENIRQISGIDEGMLRRMYVDQTPPPLLLDDTLKRFKSPSEPARSQDANAQRLQRDYPTLSAEIAEALLAGARKTDVAKLSEQQRLPLWLQVQARECVFEVRMLHAFEGFTDSTRVTIDTERLALNVLRLHSDTYADLRIEVREGSATGALRVSVGADDAATVNLLVRDPSGRYEVRDADNRPLHAPADLYDSILRIMPEAARQEIGYRPGQGEGFRDWLITQAEPPAERRAALLEPPIRPVAEPQLAMLLRGPTMSREGLTLDERVQDLYPAMQKREVQAFVQSLNTRPDPLQAIKTLEDELQQLRNTLQWWLTQRNPTLPDEPVIARGESKHIAERLMECFERKSRVFDSGSSLEEGYALDLSSQLLHRNLEREWKKLPDLKRYLDQVTTVSLDNTVLSEGATGLLKDFRYVRQLSARRCELQRLPEGVGKMHFLKTLRLTDNHIQLTAEAVGQLRNLTRLETLRLDHNPLGRSPNVERMPCLKVLSLSHTGLDAWPDGVFSKHRPRGFFLDLQGNAITQVPTVIRGSDDAWIIARTRLSWIVLDDMIKAKVFDYRESVGVPRQTLYSPAAERARNKWPVDDDSDLWGRSPGLGTFRSQAWDELMAEPNAEGFFSVIDHLTESSDYRAEGERRQQLSRRVWNMIDAIDLDTGLREELFTMATAPTNCADAGAQLFNNMGIKVLASRAISYSTNRAPLEKALVDLAKGAARLERVDEIARADVMDRGGNPDEVEVYLAYETALADRLGLPWQSESMLYRAVAGVSDGAIDQAYDTVLAMEAGDGLVNAMLEQPFWDKYLHETWPAEFQANELRYERRAGLIENLRNAQAQWAGAGEMPYAQKKALQNRLKDLAKQLALAESRVLTGEAMTDQTYADLYSDLAYQKQELAREKTRDALARA